jgi:type IX secretion system PorP/SprF family membrane protein
MRFLKLLCFIAVVLCAESSYGQQLEQSSLYMFNTLYFNPAYAGSRNAFSASLINREQWIGFDGGPSSQFFSVHSPIKNGVLNIGGHFNNDRVGARRKTSGFVDIATSLKLDSKNNRLNFGLSFGLEDYAFGLNELYAVDPNDILLASSMNGTRFNAGLGVYYFGDKHYLGFSIPSVLETMIEFQDSDIRLNQRHFLLQGGYVFQLNSVIDFKPSTLVKYTAGAPIVFDLNASFLFYEKLWLGAMYRFDEGVGVNISFVLKEKFTLAYAYDFPLNRLLNNQFGSHEVGLIFDFSKFRGQNKIYSPRYF